MHFELHDATGRPKKIVHSDFLYISCCSNRIAHLYPFLEYKIQNTSTITHANTNKTAMTIKTTTTIYKRTDDEG